MNTRYFKERDGDDAASYPETCECLGETAQALKIAIVGADDADGRTCFWIPKSVVHDDSEVYAPGTSGELIVVQWFAEKEGWV